jgi:putative transposase
MTRPLRLQYENAAYHIISRGNLGSDIFLDDRDRLVFIIKANRAFEKYSTTCFVYCLMSNHYHLFLRTEQASISRCMHLLNSSYANWYRVKHKTKGAIFQDRYKSILVEEDSYAIELSAYIHLNPVRANIVKNPLDSRWSSYRHYQGLSNSPLRRFDSSLILQYFGKTGEAARLEYHKYVMEHIQMKNPMEKMPVEFQGKVLGSERYLEKYKEKTREIGLLREIPETRMASTGQKLLECAEVLSLISKEFKVEPAEILKRERNNNFRQLLIYVLKKDTPHSLKQIGGFLGMDYSAVSIAAKRFEKQLICEPALKELLRRAEAALA